MLAISQILSYSAALGIAAAIPGPGMTALVARSVSAGALVGYSMLLGLIVGDLIFLSFAVFGLAMLAHHFSAVFVLVKWASLLYLLYLAWVFWHAKHQTFAPGQPVQKKDIVSAGISGLMITLGNPKAIAFYLALAPLVIDLTTVSLRTWALLLVPLTVFILLSVGSVFILGALSIRRILSTPRAQRMLYRGAGVCMAAAACVMAVKG